MESWKLIKYTFSLDGKKYVMLFKNFSHAIHYVYKI